MMKHRAMTFLHIQGIKSVYMWELDKVTRLQQYTSAYLVGIANEVETL